MYLASDKSEVTLYNYDENNNFKEDKKQTRGTKVTSFDKTIEENNTKYTQIEYNNTNYYVNSRNLVSDIKDSVLEKTRGFKHLRYSNGNKSIFDIIDGAFKIMSISNSNFTYNIDNRLNDYKLNYKLVKDFKNADLLNIVLNHIKKSAV
jgi:hypothetical protein